MRKAFSVSLVASSLIFTACGQGAGVSRGAQMSRNTAKSQKVLLNAGEEKSVQVAKLTAPKKKIRVSEVKYAGAIVFEGGLTKSEDLLLNTDASAKPVWQVVVCIDRSEKELSGEFQIDFAKLGVPAFRIRSYSIDAGGARLEGTDKNQDFPVVTVNYKAKGKITAYQDIAFGSISFRSETSVPMPFGVSVSEGSLAQDKFSIYTVDQQKYYVRSTLVRFVKNGEDIQIASDCEKQGQPVFVKYAADLIAK